MKKTLLTVIVSICFLLIVSSISYGQGGTAPYIPHHTYGLLLKINDGAPCTTDRRVTLKYNHCVGGDPCPQPINYWASEDPKFTGVWTGKTSKNWEYFNLTQEYGKKKVYFRTSRDNLPGSDEIDYMASCDDATFKSMMDVQILKLNQPFSFDISSIFSVSKISNANSFEINLQARAVGNNALLAQKTIPYPGGSGTGDIIKSGMTLTIPVPVGAQGGNPAYTNITLIAKIQPKPGAMNVYDYNPNNNVLQKNLQLVASTANPTHVVDKCTGHEGSKNNILSSVSHGWVFGQSTLSLHDCGTTGGEEIKCDSNPLPGVGQRGVKWTRRPTTGGQYGVHWWCEGLANKRDNSSYGYYFRFNVKYDVVNIRIP
jgi:hypothetical protein